MCDPSLLWRRYPKSDRCHQNRYLKYDEFCKSSHADVKFVAVDLLSTSRVESTELGLGLFGREEPKGGKRSGVIPDGDLRSSSRFARYGIGRSQHGAATVPEEPPSATLDRELTANIVAAYVRRNQITSDQPWMLISTVHQALTSLGKPVAELDRARIPAVPIQ